MAATIMAPKEPMPAASTGVAMPPNSRPRTRNTRKIGATQIQQQAQLVAQVDALFLGQRRAERRVDPRAQHDVADVQAGQHQARHHRAQVELADPIAAPPRRRESPGWTAG